jgi:hypothetical protein
MDDAGADHAGRTENDDRGCHGATCDRVPVPGEVIPATGNMDSRVRGKDAMRWFSPNSGIILPEFGTMPEPEAPADPRGICAGAASDPLVASPSGICTNPREASEIVADFAWTRAGNGEKSRPAAATSWARRCGSKWD